MTGTYRTVDDARAAYVYSSDYDTDIDGWAADRISIVGAHKFMIECSAPFGLHEAFMSSAAFDTAVEDIFDGSRIIGVRG